MEKINYELLLNLAKKQNIPVRKAEPGEKPGIYISDGSGVKRPFAVNDLLYPNEKLVKKSQNKEYCVMERIFIIGLTVLLILTLGILVLNAKLYPAKGKMVSVSTSIVSFVILIIIFEQIL